MADSMWRESIHAFLEDRIATGAVLVVLVLLVLSLVTVWVQYFRTRKKLVAFSVGLRNRIQAWNQARTPSTREPFWAEIERVLIFRGEQPSKIVVRDSPVPGLTMQVLKSSRSGPLGVFLSLIGKHLTAIALMITFGLLGWILMSSVHSSLKAAAGSAGDQLPDAVRLMGAKFFVSVTGLLGAWLFQFFSDLTDEWLEARASKVIAGVEDLLETIPVFQARMAYVGSQQLKKLESITVTVQGIGNEVTSHIGTIAKQQVADTICDAITELRNSAQEIAINLQSQLTTSFGQSLSTEVTRLQGGLEAVQNAIQDQSRGNLDRIVEQLRDIVSGGFSSQSEDMGRQMGQLASTLPKLEAQFAAMTDSLGRNAHEWGEENQRAVVLLSNQVAELVQQFQTVRTGMEAAVAGLAEASQRSVDKLASSASTQAGEINREMDTLRKVAADGTASFAQNTRGFMEVISRVQVELASANGTLRDTVTALATTFQQLKQSQTDQRATLQTLDQAARNLAEGGRRVGAVIEQQPAIIEREQHLLEAQRQAVDRVATVLDQMLKRYSDALSHQSTQLADSWGTLAQRVKQTVEAASLSLSESVDELNQTVRELKNGGTRA